MSQAQSTNRVRVSSVETCNRNGMSSSINDQSDHLPIGSDSSVIYQLLELSAVDWPSK